MFSLITYLITYCKIAAAKEFLTVANGKKMKILQYTLTLKMTTAQVVETSVTVNNNSPIQDYVHPDDHTQPTYEMTPGSKPFTK